MVWPQRTQGAMTKTHLKSRFYAIMKKKGERCKNVKAFLPTFTLFLFIYFGLAFGWHRCPTVHTGTPSDDAKRYFFRYAPFGAYPVALAELQIFRRWSNRQTLVMLVWASNSWRSVFFFGGGGSAKLHKCRILLEQPHFQ